MLLIISLIKLLNLYRYSIICIINSPLINLCKDKQSDDSIIFKLLMIIKDSIQNFNTIIIWMLKNVSTIVENHNF